MKERQKMKLRKANKIEVPIPGIVPLDRAIERFTVINKILCDYIANGALDYHVYDENIKDIIERNNNSIIALKVLKREILREHSTRKAK